MYACAAAGCSKVYHDDVGGPTGLDCIAAALQPRSDSNVAARLLVEAKLPLICGLHRCHFQQCIYGGNSSAAPLMACVKCCTAFHAMCHKEMSKSTVGSLRSDPILQPYNFKRLDDHNILCQKHLMAPAARCITVDASVLSSQIASGTLSTRSSPANLGGEGLTVGAGESATTDTPEPAESASSAGTSTLSGSYVREQSVADDAGDDTDNDGDDGVDDGMFISSSWATTANGACHRNGPASEGQGWQSKIYRPSTYSAAGRDPTHRKVVAIDISNTANLRGADRTAVAVAAAALASASGARTGQKRKQQQLLQPLVSSAHQAVPAGASQNFAKYMEEPCGFEHGAGISATSQSSMTAAVASLSSPLSAALPVDAGRPYGTQVSTLRAPRGKPVGSMVSSAGDVIVIEDIDDDDDDEDEVQVVTKGDASLGAGSGCGSAAGAGANGAAAAASAAGSSDVDAQVVADAASTVPPTDDEDDQAQQQQFEVLPDGSVKLADGRVIQADGSIILPKHVLAKASADQSNDEDAHQHHHRHRHQQLSRLGMQIEQGCADRYSPAQASLSNDQQDPSMAGHNHPIDEGAHIGAEGAARASDVDGESEREHADGHDDDLELQMQMELELQMQLQLQGEPASSPERSSTTLARPASAYASSTSPTPFPPASSDPQQQQPVASGLGGWPVHMPQYAPLPPQLVSGFGPPPQHGQLTSAAPYAGLNDSASVIMQYHVPSLHHGYHLQRPHQQQAFVITTAASNYSSVPLQGAMVSAFAQPPSYYVQPAASSVGYEQAMQQAQTSLSLPSSASSASTAASTSLLAVTTQHQQQQH